MINFSTLQGLTIPEGVVTQIADASGRVLWAVNVGEPIVLEVAKITSNTYVSSTSYTDEQFVLLDIYPKNANSIVKVTYCGLEKTLQFSSTSAQQVYFGTFGGVSDSVTTPASGTLTIEGDYSAFGCSSYNTNKAVTAVCSCITNVADFGTVTQIPSYAFKQCSELAHVNLPNEITSISDETFNECTNVDFDKLPDGVVSVGEKAFRKCSNLSISELPDNLESIGSYAFLACTNINISVIPNSVSSIGSYAFQGCTGLPSITISTPNIPDYAFSNCIGITNITLENGVETIGVRSFEYCDSLVRVAMPATLKTIESTAFDACEALKTIVILATVPPEGCGFDRGDADSLEEIIVPAGCGDVYKAANNWSSFADFIKEASE